MSQDFQISVSFAQIDWHDFVVVETIDFPVDEAGDLPPPVTPDELGARLIAQERYERMKVAFIVSYQFVMDQYILDLLKIAMCFIRYITSSQNN